VPGIAAVEAMITLSKLLRVTDMAEKKLAPMRIQSKPIEVYKFAKNMK
jgi:hypothetical protein